MPSSDLGIEWLAGLFEGEGCITTWKSKHVSPRKGTTKVYKGLRVIVASTDRDVLETFHKLAGCGTINTAPKKRDKPHHSTCWVWQAQGKDAIELCMKMYPYLHSRRQARFLEVLEEVNENRGSDHLPLDEQ